MSKWISVEDRLPEDDKAVLCKQVNNKDLMICRLSNNEWHESYEDIYAVGGWINSFVSSVEDNECYLRITHWMPLPEPPKGQ